MLDSLFSVSRKLGTHQNRRFLEDVSKDPAAVSSVYREYLQNLQKPTIESAPKQPKDPVVNEKQKSTVVKQ